MELLSGSLSQGPSFDLEDTEDENISLPGPDLDICELRMDMSDPRLPVSDIHLNSTSDSKSEPTCPPIVFNSKKRPNPPYEVNTLMKKMIRPNCTNNQHFRDQKVSEASSDSSCHSNPVSKPHSSENAPPEVAASIPSQNKFSVAKHRSLGLTRKPFVFSGDSTARFSRIPLSESKHHENQQLPIASNANSLAKQKLSCSSSSESFYSVMYCVKKKNAKRKGPWFDGVLIVRGRTSTLLDDEGKTVCKGDYHTSKELDVDAIVEVNKYEAEIVSVVSSEEYKSGKLFSGCFDSSTISAEGKSTNVEIKNKTFLRHNVDNECIKGPPKLTRGHSLTSLHKVPKDALILNSGFLGDSSMPIILDPYIASQLRPHQREGVKFLYECVMGLRTPAFSGCILADEMGLGKTLQVIALVWSLLQQPSGKKPDATFKHIIVVCPSSLVQNWGNEVKKWLGSERLKALVVHAGLQKEVEQKLLDFKNGKINPLLITSYELLRKHQELLTSSKPELLICDEAHRLKNSAGNKTIMALLSLNCPRRVLLTGTPIQNDLNEFYAMVDFANPNLLGPLSAFKRLYAEPIELSRDRNASDEQRKLGEARFMELQARTKFCILRRTAAVNKSYLPAKTEYLVFCRLQPLQVSLYESFVKSQFVTRLFLSESNSANVLSAIGILRKLCNHPRLVVNDLTKEILETVSKSHSIIDDLVRDSDVNVCQQQKSKTEYMQNVSGKLDCLSALLSTAFDPHSGDPTDRAVVVSNFTQTLNIIQSLCESKSWTFLRLDGTTAAADRQCLVDRFNSGLGGERVFLLSSKAGGVGLNLVGANRLILFDPDWNPATDAQAMARIWREGQKKPVIIYRLFSTGTIEEKIYQRQMVKSEIAATIEDNAESRRITDGGRFFSREELKKLFTLNLDTKCDTNDLLSGRALCIEEKWNDCSQDISDSALKAAVNRKLVSFVQTKVQALVSSCSSAS